MSNETPVNPKLFDLNFWIETMERFRVASRVASLPNGELTVNMSDGVGEGVRTETILGAVRRERAEAAGEMTPEAKRELVEDVTLGQLAYTAYATVTGWKNYQGAPMPDWYDLPEAIRTAWLAAAKAVRNWSTVSVEDL